MTYVLALPDSTGELITDLNSEARAKAKRQTFFMLFCCCGSVVNEQNGEINEQLSRLKPLMKILRDDLLRYFHSVDPALARSQP